MRKHSKFLIGFTLIIVSLLSTSCDNHKEKTVTTNNPNQYPHTTYISINPNYLPNIIQEKTSLINDLIDTFPEAGIIHQNISNIPLKSINTYHFFWTEKPSHTLDYTLIIVTSNPIEQQKILSTTQSEKYHVTSSSTSMTITTSNTIPKYISPDHESFLTIHSINPDLLPIYINSEDTPSTINQHTIKHLIHSLNQFTPINLYYKNNHILIGQPLEYTIENISYLSYSTTFDHLYPNAYNTILYKQINEIVHYDYLDFQDLNYQLIQKINLNTEDKFYQISLEYPDQNTTQEILEQIKKFISSQEKYQPSNQILPDNTNTLLLQPNKETINSTNQNQSINFSNYLDENITISQSNNHIIISNSTDLTKYDNQTINIPFTTLHELIPEIPDKYNFLKSIQIGIENDQIIGNIIK